MVQYVPNSELLITVFYLIEGVHMEEREESKKEKRDKRYRVNWSLVAGAEILIVVIAFFLGFAFRSMLYRHAQPKITSAYLGSRLTEMSDLTSAELDYDGLLMITEGGIPLITEKGFSMRYTAKIKAGIDVSEVEVDVTDEKVTVELPEAEILSVDVDEDSIVFYDKRYAIFNWQNSMDVVDAVKAAKEDAEAMANVRELKEKSEEQTEKIVRELLKDAAGDRELVVKHKVPKKEGE